MLRKVKDLSPSDKSTVERLLGRPLSDNETVSLQAFEEPEKTQAERNEIAERLKAYFAEVDANKLPVSPEEEEEIINEAMRSVRPSYRPLT